MSVLTYDTMVAALVSSGVPRAKAEAKAREECRLPGIDLGAEKREAVLEQEEQREVAKIFQAFRFRVWWLSQSRATKQTPGISDLFLTHETLSIAFWWETKRQKGGKLSTAQVEFREHCLRCGVRHYVGDRHAAAQLLVSEGLAEIVNGILEPLRARLS